MLRMPTTSSGGDYAKPTVDHKSEIISGNAIRGRSDRLNPTTDMNTTETHINVFVTRAAST
ncbi:MAG: hypothetical protein GWP30_05840 [Actinobacteria bacterium]|nr:hypothetical protein [Actinomycetota bacterium]